MKPLDVRQQAELQEQLRREMWTRGSWPARLALVTLMSRLSAALVAAIAAQFTHHWVLVAAAEGGGVLLVLVPFAITPRRAITFWFRGMSVSDAEAATPKRFGAI